MYLNAHNSQAPHVVRERFYNSTHFLTVLEKLAIERNPEVNSFVKNPFVMQLLIP